MPGAALVLESDGQIRILGRVGKNPIKLTGEKFGSEYLSTVFLKSGIIYERPDLAVTTAGALLAGLVWGSV